MKGAQCLWISSYLHIYTRFRLRRADAIVRVTANLCDEQEKGIKVQIGSEVTLMQKHIFKTIQTTTFSSSSNRESAPQRSRARFATDEKLTSVDIERP